MNNVDHLWDGPPLSLVEPFHDNKF